jgi:regulator of RNase E activity RraA
MPKARPTKRVSQKVLRQLRTVTTPTITTQLLKQHGLHNTALRGVLPLDPSLPPFAGPAYTLRYVPLREDLLAAQWMDHPENLMTPAIEDAPKGAVFLMEAGGCVDAGLLGGNIVMRLKMRGLAAAVTDGAMRDIPEMGEIGWPVCCSTIAAPPSMARLMLADTQCPVSVGGVAVFPGDVIVGDSEGVVAVPAHLAAEVAEAGLAQDHIEGWVNRELAKGGSIKGLYPPGPNAMAAYEAWVAAGEPDEN